MYPPQGILEIDGQRYEWRYHDCICGLYEVEAEEGPASVMNWLLIVQCACYFCAGVAATLGIALLAEVSQ